MSYVGRFAPSPTGPLHFGSLLAALASYLDAKANDGHWLLRMEDLDPPREPEGAADTILQQLEDLSLHWDGEVLYQSSRLESYQQTLDELRERNLCFPCNCTRPQIKAMGSVYNGHCRGRDDFDSEATSIRVRTDERKIAFTDLIYGDFVQNVEKEVGDFVIRRKDGLFAYQLAVVVDDGFQGITHIVRGFDLLDSTPRQIYLQQVLSLSTPVYAHIPILVDGDGNKLSKQQFAEPIDVRKGPKLIYSALQLLNQNPNPALKMSSTPEQLAWATEHWDIQAVPKLANMTVKALN
ncbi:MAG: tRNA glutamyl-Q(34) synthetase GluQRS [Pseudomonadales bacterium]|nr:tRNA glutamyl-Q(34) synthetase GluQRS [Pseudomonadales bacterium]